MVEQKANTLQRARASSTKERLSKRARDMVRKATAKSFRDCRGIEQVRGTLARRSALIAARL